MRLSDTEYCHPEQRARGNGARMSPRPLCACFKTPNFSTCLLILITTVLPAQTTPAAERQVLHGHIPMAVTESHLQPVGQLSGSTNLNLAVGLPLRNKEELNSLLQQIYDPASPQYHHYLTPEQFTERFGPTEQDYQTLIDFVTANGVTVTGRHPGRTLLDVRGSVANIEKSFHLTMRVYQHPTEPRTFYAPDVEPSLDLAVPVLHINGLDNYTVPHPKQLIRKPSREAKTATPNAGSGPSGAYTGHDFRDAYVPGVSLTGSGQAVGLVEFDGYYANDIATYEAQNGLRSVTLVNVLLDGFDGTPTTGPNSGNDEVALDIEMSISMAPGLSKVIVYEAGPNWRRERHPEPNGLGQSGQATQLLLVVWRSGTRPNFRSILSANGGSGTVIRRGLGRHRCLLRIDSG